VSICLLASVSTSVSTVGKKLLNNDTSSTCPHNMVNFDLLTAEICWRVWGTPANFNGFRVLVALLHDTVVVVGGSQTLRRWTEGATCIWQGDHHVGHWLTFWLNIVCFWLIFGNFWISVWTECSPRRGPSLAMEPIPVYALLCRGPRCLYSLVRSHSFNN